MVAILILRIILAGIFALAAFSKLADKVAFRNAVVEFGLPGRMVGPISLLLPWLELGVVFLLLLSRSGKLGGIAALALLTGFSAAIAVNLVRGRKPDCHCFGQLHSAPIGWKTIARNMAFAVCASVVTWGPSDPSVASITRLYPDFGNGRWVWGSLAAAAVGAFLAQTWLAFHLLRQQGRVLIRLDKLETILRVNGLSFADNAHAHVGLRIGSLAPSFEIPLLSGDMTSLERIHRRGRQTLLVFSDPGCSPCTALLPDIARWQREYEEKLTVAVITSGSAGANRNTMAKYRFQNVLLQRDREVAEKYAAVGTPAALLIDEDGLIGSSLAMGAEAIGNLVAQAAGQSLRPTSSGARSSGQERLTAERHQLSHNRLQVGDRAPSFRLVDLNANVVDLTTNFNGRNTLLFFWNPSCGFCKSMLPALKTWEGSRKQPSLALLMISSGTAELNFAMQLNIPIALDQHFNVGRTFGVTGTPSAVLIDSDGRIAAPIAVGAPQIHALAAMETDHQPV